MPVFFGIHYIPVFVALLVSPVTLLLLVSAQEFLPLLFFFFSWLGGFEKS